MTQIKTKEEYDKLMKTLRTYYEENKDDIVLTPFEKSFGCDEL